MNDQTNPIPWSQVGREEDRHHAMFGNRRYDLLEGKVKAQNKAIMALISTTERQGDLINDQKARIDKLEMMVRAINAQKSPLIPDNKHGPPIPDEGWDNPAPSKFINKP